MDELLFVHDSNPGLLGPVGYYCSRSGPRSAQVFVMVVVSKLKTAGSVLMLCFVQCNPPAPPVDPTKTPELLLGLSTDVYFSGCECAYQVLYVRPFSFSTAQHSPFARAGWPDHYPQYCTAVSCHTFYSYICLRPHGMNRFLLC